MTETLNQVDLTDYFTPLNERELTALIGQEITILLKDGRKLRGKFDDHRGGLRDILTHLTPEYFFDTGGNPGDIGKVVIGNICSPEVKRAKIDMTRKYSAEWRREKAVKFDEEWFRVMYRAGEGEYFVDPE